MKEKIKQMAMDIGFDLAGVARARPLPEQEKHLRQWLAHGRQADMHFLQETVDERVNPELLLPGAQSVIMLAMSYAQEAPDLSRLSGMPEGRVARYALGKDYHYVLVPRLAKLAAYISELSPGAQCRCFVDSGPLLERAYAREAGIGFIGKNNCLIHPVHGSWLVLGAIVATVPLEPDYPMEDQCGDCERCLRACPTGALEKAYTLNARKCFSYLTIEHHGAFPEQYEECLGMRLFGCDSCQACCPFNRDTPGCQNPELMPAADPEGDSIDGGNASLSRILGIGSNRDFQKRLSQSPMLRARRRGLLRNAIIVAGNQKRTDLNNILFRIRDDASESDLLRATAERILRC
ncbi:MAG: tRNA epoxyqueuosine(34) reductase QueG [Candidatus Sumerlaeia bacterium]